MTEEWKPIKGFEGLYEVSNFGNILSLKWRGGSKPKLMTPIIHKNGYCNMALSKNGVIKRCLVHRLVAEAFISNPYNLPQINHKDEIKTNNHVSNLEWCTQAYNNVYGTRLSKIARKKRCKSID